MIESSVDLRTFTYEPLQNPSEWIRLAHIHSPLDGDSSNVISITLKSFRRAPDLHYDALSYTWGDSTKTEPIVVNASRFEATKNLIAALQQLRDSRLDKIQRSNLIWIDALCINQNDEEEKSKQVQMMRNIFGSAVQVLVCLGPADKQLQNGLEAVATVAQSCAQRWMSRPFDNSFPCEEDINDFHEILNILRTQRSDYSTLSSIQHVYQQSWWERVWVIQEVAVGKQAWVIGRNAAVDYKWFGCFYGSVQRLSVISRMGGQELTRDWNEIIWTLVHCTQRTYCAVRPWTEIGHTDLLAALIWLFVTGRNCASDPRDLFYALGGLGVGVDEAIGRVDYTLPWPEVHAAAAQHLLLTRGLSVLSFCTYNEDRQMNELPSWAPDWTQHVPCPIVFNNFNDMETLYLACGTTSQSLENRFTGKHLKLSGCRVASIEAVSEISRIPQGGENTGEAIVSAMRELRSNIIEFATSLELPDNLRDAIVMRVMSGDTEYTNERKRLLMPADESAYQAAMRYIQLPLRDEPGYDMSFEKATSEFHAGNRYIRAVDWVAESRRVFKSSAGQIGLAPQATKRGDLLCIFLGATVPFILRETGEDAYLLIGEAYADGIMDGEFMKADPKTELFTLT
ncbi:uncharacterized protein PV09_07173 [Verruconis gallopava]|uniref:Heterokaryon incompatibility domain-containing protein n=1 Tax=Verruconis gallopava TaxID=253628 RepID=A0A0D2AQI2_9PEZI|nr:uncharacterized protein PV09_07173 [Verruconis gallopava]KIW01409.1 hypothetical protein PV09_07173 [Verruconis gallopava]